jgi:Mg-chelatase subunit ChlI
MSKPLLHLVFGGRVADPRKADFVDTDNLHVVGIFPNYATALKAWRGASQSRVDEADWKYVVVHIHRLLEPTPVSRMLEPDRRDQATPPVKQKKPKTKKKAKKKHVRR